MKKNIVTIAMAFVFSAGVFAAESAQAQKESPATPTKEMREQMAKNHEKMALCLRSEATIQDCHEQMREQCQDMKSEGGCFMMDKGMMGKGMMKNRKKSDPPK